MQDVLENILHWHSRVIETLRLSISGSSAFCVTRVPSLSPAVVGTTVEGSHFSNLSSDAADALWTAFAPCPAVRKPPGRSCDEGDVTVLGSSFARFDRLATDRARLLVHCLRRGDQVFGVVGVARHADEEEFARADRERLPTIGATLSDLAALFVGYGELRRRELLHQAFPGFAGTCWVVDRTTRRVVWSFTTDHDDDENRLHTLLADELPGQGLLDRVLPPEDGNEPPPSFPMFHGGRLVQIAELNGHSLFDGHACMAIAVSAMATAGGELSRRERQIVRLLLAGYKTINAAAILNVSESTVRTYVRRIYRKLEVTSRAHLAQKCHFRNGAYGGREGCENVESLAMRS